MRATSARLPENMGEILKHGHSLQLKLGEEVIFRDRLPKQIRYVAGIDVAYLEDKSICAVAVLDFQSLSIVESAKVIRKTSFPYVPTLLGFRENPIAIKAVKKLVSKPDVYMIDGHGIAHPYKCGFACQFGLSVGKPTIGVAKNLLYGEIDRKKDPTSGTRYLRANGEIIGAAVVTHSGFKPVFVSVGNLISLASAIEIVRSCSRDHRVPEPLRVAHLIATGEKRKIKIRTARRRRWSGEICQIRN